MKIALCLFVLCVGLLPAVFAEGHPNIPAVGEIVKHIDKFASDKKERVLKLENQRESGLLKLVKSNRKKISNLMKSSNNNKYENLKVKALEAQNITVTSAHLILNLVNKTIDDLRKTLQEAGETVTELTKLCLSELKDYADKCMTKMIKHNNITEAKIVYKNELLWISLITEASIRRISELVRISSISVGKLEHSSGVLVIETADKQAKKLEPLKADNEKLKKFIAFALDKIKELAKVSADKYKELVTVFLKRLKALESKSLQSLTTLTQLEIKTANETIAKSTNLVKPKANETIAKPTKPTIMSLSKKPIVNGTKINDDDKYEKEFNDFMKQLNITTAKLMTDATQIVAEIKGQQEL